MGFVVRFRVPFLVRSRFRVSVFSREDIGLVHFASLGGVRGLKLSKPITTVQKPPRHPSTLYSALNTRYWGPYNLFEGTRRVLARSFEVTFSRDTGSCCSGIRLHGAP